MARFTFSAGNARVLARAPLYAAGAVLSRLVPRSPNRWVYGSGIGLGEGALALYDAAAARDGDTRSHVWLASTAAERDAARARGMTSERKTGPRGLWLTLRAGVAVVTHGAGDVNRFGVNGTRLIQLWHGIPLKRLHLDTAAALRLPLVGSLPGAQRLMAALYRRVGDGIALFPVASAAVGARIRSAFGLPADRVVALGEPRDDVLLAGDATSRRRDARARIEAAVGPLDNGPVVLYAPTWRDGDPDPAAYNQSMESYLMDFVLTLGKVFDAMLDFVAGAPRLPVQQYPRDFIDFVNRHNLPIPVWSAAPDVTVIDILARRRVL